MMHPLLQTGFPQAIVHLDGDAFFASVEQAIHPELKGRPIVTGKERGIIACASYEAKKLGIKRGIPLWEAEKMCKDLVVVPSDYEMYSLFSKRMFDIMRRFTPMVEEHSIDEGFADISGLRRLYHTSYQDIARQMKEAIEAELGIGVSVGLSLSKSLAKLASKFRKPHGFTPVAGYHVHLFLPRIPLEGVWGFGPNTVHLLKKQGLQNAYDFIQKPEEWADRWLGKIGREIWNELRGRVVYPVTTEAKSSYATISKCKTFTAPSDQRDFVYAKLVRNVESACIKLRRYTQRARTLVVILKRQDFTTQALEARLNRPTSATQEMMPVAREMYDQLYEAGTIYRATMVVMGKLESDRCRQGDLFEDRVRIEAMARASEAIDEINERFGKHTVSLGTSLNLNANRVTGRNDQPWRKSALLKGESKRQRLNLPLLSIKV
jgi:DNA polymerase-4/DNA polymerase V